MGVQQEANSHLGEKLNGSSKKEFFFGSKRLTLYDAGSELYSFVKAVENTSRLPQETTILYTFVREYLQQLANSRKLQLKYIFSTKIPSMKAWAESKGQNIFQWQSKCSMGGTPPTYEFIAIIKPI